MNDFWSNENWSSSSCESDLSDNCFQDMNSMSNSLDDLSQGNNLLGDWSSFFVGLNSVENVSQVNNLSSDNSDSVDQFMDSSSNSSDDSSLNNSSMSFNKDRSTWFTSDNMNNMVDLMNLVSDLSDDSSQDNDLSSDNWSFWFWNSWKFNNQFMDGSSDNGNLLVKFLDGCSEGLNNSLLFLGDDRSSWPNWVVNSDNSLFNEDNVSTDSSDLSG